MSAVGHRQQKYFIETLFDCYIVPEASSQSALQSHPPGHCTVFYRDHSPGGGLFVVDRIHRCPGKEISNDHCTRHCLVIN